MGRVRIAVIDDEISVCRSLSRALSNDGHEVEAFTTAKSFLDHMARTPFDIVFTDLKLPDGDGMEILAAIKAVRPETEVVVVTGYGTIDSAVEAVKQGAFHYAVKPVKLGEIRVLVQKALEKIDLRFENVRLRQALKNEDSLNSIVGTSDAMRNVFSVVGKVAGVDCNILIEGASGTGKALVARAVHRLSPRKERPFVSFNCGGFTEELISSELFGYEKGAFTGATATKIGLLESGTGGTVFLDEVGEMPLSMQVKLLHVIQERQILRVGGVRPIELDIRIVAATNRDLKQEVEQGNFREDLFYRLNVVTIQIPRLNERREDIPLLVKHFMEKYSLTFRKPVAGVHPQALQILSNYTFPGNVRELENIIERAVALMDDDVIQCRDLPQDLRQLEFDSIEGEGLFSLEELERRYISRVLERTGYNKSLTAQILDIPRTTLWRKLRAYKL